jgi:hypothetical protein
MGIRGRAVRAVPADHPWQLVLGPSIWALWFVLVYAGVSVACATAPPPPARASFTWINLGLLLLTLVTTGGLVLAARACRRAIPHILPGPERPRRRFMASAAAMLHAISAASVAFVGLPLLVFTPCV